MNITKHMEKWIGVIVAAIFGQLLGTLYFYFLFEIGIRKSFGGGILWAVVSSILYYMADFIPKIEEKITDTLSARMGQIIQFAALGTSNGNWEKHLEKLKDGDLGNLKWAVAKFISFKLGRHFNDVNRIEIDNVTAEEYTGLLADLTKECTESICFTCPYTPSEWLKIAIKDPCKDNCPDANECDYKIMEGHLAEHMRVFCLAKVKEKKRVINIDGTALGQIKKDRCLDNFTSYYLGDRGKKKEIKLEGHCNIETRFVAQESLESTCGDLKDKDYNVLDRKLVMKWNSNNSDSNSNFKKNVGTCVLIFDRGEVERHMRIFENINAAHYKKNDANWPLTNQEV